MNLSSLSFGILFLLKASFAQSAPHSYPDEDEEALIDKLASLAAAVGPDALLSKPLLSPNYDISQLGYLGGPPELNDDMLAREAVLKLPRQFGYKPNDIRFYLPAEQFPQYASPPLQEEQAELDNVMPNVRANSILWRNQLNDNSIQDRQQQRLPLSANPEPPSNTNAAVPLAPPAAGQYVHHSDGGQHEVVDGQSQSDFYFMKKKEQSEDLDEPTKHLVPGPSHVMASDHSANFPGFSSTQITDKNFTYSDMYYIAIIAGCSAAAVVGIMAAGICWYRIHERIKAAADVDYPAYGVTGPSKDVTPSGGDRKLAASAHMYHYQHQKQQMAALQKGAIQGDRQGSGGSDVESDDDNEDGDYTVYECPGLAPAGEMEVKNPLFQDEPTPATPQTSKGSEEEVEAGSPEKK
ncbi:unnamed protein product [Orchesella dallaii]|uniref:Neural proliferation differentiation and control protein 1 n=1 Tax=Orchesella dallaii TaxID=48710 RepID=A0ABP1S4L3_9HEXA